METAKATELRVLGMRPKIQTASDIKSPLVGSFFQVVTPDLGQGKRWKPFNRQWRLVLWRKDLLGSLRFTSWRSGLEAEGINLMVGRRETKRVYLPSNWES